jgi:hypothetical protein
MVAHYGLSLWEYGIFFTGILVTLTLYFAIVAEKYDRMMKPANALVFGSMCISSGYFIIGPCPYLPFLSGSSVWIAIVGSVVWACGMATPMVCCGSYITNASVSAGWPEIDAAIEWSTIGVVTIGLALVLGAPLSSMLIESLGVGYMCTVFATFWFGLGVILTSLNCFGYTSSPQAHSPKDKRSERSPACCTGVKKMRTLLK